MVNTLFYCYRLNTCGFIVEIAKNIFGERELKKCYYKESNHFYSTPGFFIIDCSDFYGKTLLEFILEYTEHASVLKTKNLFILNNFDELDKDTQNKIASKMDRTWRSSIYWATCSNHTKISGKILNRILNINIPLPDFISMKTYLIEFIKKLSINLFEPVLDKIIQLSEGDVYKAVFYIELFTIDHNVINRKLLDGDIDRILSIITDRAYLEKNFHELREIAYQCLEKSELILILYKLISRVCDSKYFNEIQKNKVIDSIASLQNNEKLYSKNIYILEAVLSKMALILYETDIDSIDLKKTKIDNYNIKIDDNFSIIVETIIETKKAEKFTKPTYNSDNVLII
jgi:DNA polymerase III delta prime subunit